jgi:YebC/PmpR family DNA-binding regulatory protein
MSGHSKWANIKNRKGSQDKKRSEVFTKMSKNIMTAIRAGGSNSNPESNTALREAIEKARVANMPKENIERLLQKYEERKANLFNFRFEGFGPMRVPLVIEVETDNKNRSLGEIKLLFRDYGGNLGSEGSVDFMFDRVGEIEIEGELSGEEQLELIELGVKEFEGSNVLITGANQMKPISDRLKERGRKILQEEMVERCHQKVKLKSEDEVEKVMDLIDALEENDDVISVFSGFEFQ